MTKHVPKETNITNSILDYLNSLPRCYARKRYQNIYQRNIPDIDCGIHGWYYMFEVKRPGETSTPAQRAEQAKARKGGIRVYEVHSKDEVKAIMVADGWDDLPTRGERHD